MLRTFTHGAGSDRKVVSIEVNGRRMGVVQGKPDGTTRRSEKELKSEAEARSACELMARELMARGFVEQSAAGPTKARPAAAPKVGAATQPAAPTGAGGGAGMGPLLLEEGDADGEPAPVLHRLGPAPAAAGRADGEAPKKKKKKSGGKKKKRQKAEGADGLDKRVIYGVAAVAAAFVAFAAFFIYDSFLKPASIVGIWQGSRLEYEIGKSLTHTSYRLVLDEKKRAALTLQGDYTTVGTYTVKGDLLTLKLQGEKGEEGEEGAPSEVQYKIALGRATLELFDPSSGKKMVQLVRLHEKPAVGGGAPAPSAPKDVAAAPGAEGKVDEAADARLASVQFSPKDGAFKVRHPQGWTPETGSRPDNTYSWARFTKGSAKIQVFADVAGSLMSGSDSAGQHEEGSPAAPVHSAHLLYKKTVADEYSDYKEGEPILFKGAPLGEGRIAAFSASDGGLFGGRIQGLRVTLLTHNRRVTILCECPEAEFAKYKPTFLAVCRSASN